MPLNSSTRYEPRPPTPIAPILIRSFAPITRPVFPGRAPNALPAIPKAAPIWAACCTNCLRLTELSSTIKPSFEPQSERDPTKLYTLGDRNVNTDSGQGAIGKDYAIPVV